MQRFLFALLTATLPLSAQDAYELRFQRPYKAGDALNVSAKVAVDNVSTTSANNNLIEQEREIFNATLEGKMEVVAVDAKGLPTSIKIKVSKSTNKQDKAPEEPFKPGDVIEVTKNTEGDEAFKINKIDATAEQKALLEAFEFTTGDLMPDPKHLNKGEKMKAGQNVPATAETAAAILEYSPIKGVKPDSVKGACQLVQVRDVDGQKCLNFSTDTSIAASGMPLPNQKTYTVTSFTLEAFSEGDYPLDSAVQPPWQKRSILMEMAATGQVEQEGQKYQITFSMHGKQVREMRLQAAK